MTHELRITNESEIARAIVNYCEHADDGACAGCIERALRSMHPADDGEPVKPLTRERIERAVEGLFLDERRQPVERLYAGEDWISKQGVVAHLCRELGVEP